MNPKLASFHDPNFELNNFALFSQETFARPICYSIAMPAKLFATINSANEPVSLERKTPSGPWTLNGEGTPDLEQTGPGMYSVVHQGRSFKALVIKHEAGSGLVRLRIGSKCHTVCIEDERSRLMQVLGIDQSSKAVMHELKAPMPGLVLKMLVKEGDTVKKNDPLLILEAMKMENVIKSSGDAVVKKIHVNEHSAVEKGQLLLSFE